LDSSRDIISKELEKVKKKAIKNAPQKKEKPKKLLTFEAKSVIIWDMENQDAQKHNLYFAFCIYSGVCAQTLRLRRSR